LVKHDTLDGNGNHGGQYTFNQFRALGGKCYI